MVIDDNGNVGIGINTPLAQLTVYGKGQATSNIRNDGNLGGYLLLRSSNINAETGGGVLFGSTSGGNGSWFASIQGWIINGNNYSYGDLTFSTRRVDTDIALTESMRITGGGNVGIGTIIPTKKLHVYNDGNCYIGADAPTVFLSVFSLMADGVETGAIYREGNTNDTIIYTAGGGPRARFPYSGAGFFLYNLNSGTGAADLRYNTGDGQVFYDSSSIRYKTVISETADTSIIYNLKVKTYDRKDGSYKNEIGLIAEEVNEVLPNLTYSDKDGNIEGYNKSDLVPYLLNEIQKHEGTINRQEAIIKDLVRRIELLENK